MCRIFVPLWLNAVRVCRCMRRSRSAASRSWRNSGRAVHLRWSRRSRKLRGHSRCCSCRSSSCSRRRRSCRKTSLSCCKSARHWRNGVPPLKESRHSLAPDWRRPSGRWDSMKTVSEAFQTLPSDTTVLVRSSIPSDNTRATRGWMSERVSLSFY